MTQTEPLKTNKRDEDTRLRERRRPIEITPDGRAVLKPIEGE